MQIPKLKLSRLFDQLLFSHLTVLLIAILGLGAFTLISWQHNAYNNLKYYLTLEARGLNGVLLEGNSASQQAIDNLLAKGLRLNIFDSEGQLLFQSQEMSAEFEKLWLRTRDSKEVQDYKFYNRVEDLSWYFIFRPNIDEQGQVIGITQLGTPVLDLNRGLQDSLYTLISVAFLLASLTVFAILGLANWITKPLEIISSEARHIAETGELKAELAKAPSEEIDELVSSFNLMVYKLREEKQFQKSFISNASHELKTPVMAINSALEVLEGQDFAKDKGELRYFFEAACRQGRRLEDLIQDLLDQSALERGSVSLDYAEFPLLDFVSEIAKDMELLAQQKNIDFSWLVEDDCTLTADRHKLRRALINLLSNAIKHAHPERGEVLFSAEISTERIRFCVQDNGHGIPAAEQELIFERFYRAEYDRSRQTGGSGLGLSIVQQIVALHGGSVSLQSELGEGSAFVLELPRHRSLLEKV